METIGNIVDDRTISAYKDVNHDKEVDGRQDINRIERVDGVKDVIDTDCVDRVNHANGFHHINAGGNINDIKLKKSARVVNGVEAVDAIHVNGLRGNADPTIAKDRGMGSDPLPCLAPIAIVGMGLRLPGGANSSDLFWDLLINKKSGRCEVPSDRYNVDAFYSPTPKAGTVATRHGHFLQNVDLRDLDTSFFSMGKAEVEDLDPQQRMLLEVVRECLENAGEIAWRGKKIGCYVGVFGEDWLDAEAKDTQKLGLYRVTGTGDFVLGNRVSYEYDLKGPSMTIKAGCSSAMIGLHMACQALFTGDCSAAVVCGTNIIITPTMTIAMTEQGVLSPTGSCNTFDAGANGYSRGEAINAIYIKRLTDAIRDGNPIRAIIRSTSTNCDGKTPGIACPSVQSHESIIRHAYKVAQIDDLTQTAFVECHGTGTPVGDPLEAQAIANVFGDHGVFIGSVKPNVGHSEGASGITSIIKMVLALEKRIIPPNINFSKPNPKIPFAARKLQVPVDAMPWPEKRERVSVNSFGIGGSNAHVILDSAASFEIDVISAVKAPGPQLLVFSANHPDSLSKIINNYRDYIVKNQIKLADLAYTLGARREHLTHRAYCVLQPGANLEVTSVSKPSASPKCVFVFTGQGAQWVGMGKELIEDYSSFLDDIKAMDKVLAELPHAPPWTLEDKLVNFQIPKTFSEAEFAQPLCVAIQVAMVNLLKRWGVSPTAVVGHSSGEIAAAYATHAISAAEAITIAFYRGKVADYQTQSGGMAAVGLGKAEIFPHLRKGVEIACENSPDSTTLSGSKEQLDIIVQTIKTNFPDIFVRLLNVNIAYHSIYMKEFSGIYQSLIHNHVHSQPPEIPFYSSVYGKRLADAERLDSSYWRRNLTSPVCFHTAIEALLGDYPQPKIFLEIGPHSALAAPLRQIFSHSETQAPYIPTLVRGQNCTERLLTTMGELYLHAVVTKFSAMHQGGIVLTDLPIYPWHHETKYWSESRLTKNWRLREHAQHEILGSCIAESSAFEPSWRNVLNLSNVPWLRDHRIHEDIVFPIAGYIVMIGEAIRQIVNAEDYSLRHILVSAAMILQESESTEIMTSLRLVRLTSTLDSTWYDFSISSFNGSAWTKHCVGQVKAGSDRAISARNIERFQRKVSSLRWYRTMKKVGLNYGPAFHGLEDISASPNDRVAVADIVDHLETNETHYQLHPTVIDLCLQLFSVAMAKGRPHMWSQLFVPTSIAELYVHRAKSAIRAEAAISSMSKEVINGNAIALANGEVVVRMKGLALSLLEDNEASKDLDPHTAACLIWKPDIDFLNSMQLIATLGRNKESLLVAEKLTLLCILETCHALESSDTSSKHMRKYRSWLCMQKHRAERGEYDLIKDAKKLTSLDSNSRLALIETVSKEIELSATTPWAIGVHRVFKNIQKIYQGKIDSLEVLLEDGVLQSIYDESPLDYSKFIDLITHSKPRLRILEIGAGTGGATADILESLTSSFGERMYSEYYFTDISPGFFVAAKDRFKNASNIVYAALDIAKDPVEQGFKEGFFDLIIAANVLHATPKINSALRNVRKLLHPEGKLLLQELCPTVRSVNYIMGVFPGWWLGEGDNRHDEPYISPERWEQELLNSGFGGTDAVVYDQDDPYQVNASILASPLKTASFVKRVTFLYDSELSPMIEQAQACFVDAGFMVDLCSLTSTLPMDQYIISLLDIERPFFDRMDGFKFDLLKNIIFHLKSAGMLWVTKSAQIECQDPRYAQVLGFARVLRNELSVDLATLEFDHVSENSWGTLLGVFGKFQRRRENPDSPIDYEYAVSKNEIHVGRYHWYSLKQHLLEDAEEKSAKTLQIGTLGLLQTLKWAQTKTKSLSADEVEIKSCAVGMNFRDVLECMGLINTIIPENGNSAILGCEASGIVSRTGPDVKSVKVGDRVAVMAGGTFTTHLTISSSLCAKIPDNLSFEEAATMPCTFATVIHSLIEIARLQKDQSVLIHSACGGVGIAAIHICRMIGSAMFVTVGNEEKVQYLMDTFGIPRHRIFNSRNISFLSDLMRETEGRGVDVVLNSLSGELLHASWQCVAEFGCMIEIGKRDLRGRAQLSMDLFEANRTFVGVDLAQIAAKKPHVCRRLIEKAMEYYRQGLIWPVKPIKFFEASHIEDAFRYMQKGQHIGKIVVKMPEDPVELPATLAKKTLLLRSDVSYLLVGGLGGLGKAISNWMVEQGAKNLIYLSRSAEDSTHKTFVSELRAQGCSVQLFKGNVSRLQDVKKAVQNASKPIAGMIQMSMQLKDQALEQTTAEDWELVLSPKVTGTWNLHEALAAEVLDFFILFGSLSGTIGQQGQVSYAAANTFLDSFVQYRHLQNFPASVIDIGVVEDVGYVSQNQTVMDQLNRLNYKSMNEGEFLNSLQLAIARSAPPHPSGLGFTNPNQILTGLALQNPSADPTGTYLWRDARMQIYRNLETAVTSKSAGEREGLKQFLSSVAADPSFLDADPTLAFLTHEISLCISNFMLTSVDDLDVTRSLADIGIDSLLAIELRNWWRQNLGVEITVLEIMDSVTVQQLGKVAASKLHAKYSPQSESPSAISNDYLVVKAP